MRIVLRIDLMAPWGARLCSLIRAVEQGDPNVEFGGPLVKGAFVFVKAEGEDVLELEIAKGDYDVNVGCPLVLVRHPVEEADGDGFVGTLLRYYSLYGFELEGWNDCPLFKEEVADG